MLAAARQVFSAALIATVVASPALAWPDRPVRLVVGFQAGGSNDVIARLLADRLRSELGGATIIVDNKPGAASTIAADAVLSARDRHTLLVAGDSILTASLVNRSVRYRLSRDFKPVSLVAEGPLILLAGPSAPFRDFAGFVDYAKGHPGKVNYGSAGIGGQQHLTGEFIATALKLELTHVPTRGGSQATTDLVGGQIETAVLGIGPTLPHIRSGKLKALAVSTASRVPQLPDVPTLIEAGVGDFAIDQWFGVVAPGDMPDAVVDQLARAIGATLGDEGVRRRLEEVGFMARASTPEAFANKIQAQESRWKRLIDERGLKLD